LHTATSVHHCPVSATRQVIKSRFVCELFCNQMTVTFDFLTENNLTG